MNKKIEELADKLSGRTWAYECNLILEAFESVTYISLKELGEKIGRSKAYISKSLDLARGLRANPNLHKIPNRNAAYKKILKEKKLNQFLNKK